MKILFLSRWFPFPITNGSKLRIYNLLRGLGEHHDVTLLSFTDQANTNLDRESSEIRSFCSDVQVVPWKEYNPHSGQAKLGLLSLKPRYLLDTHSAQMESLIRQTVSSRPFNLIITSQLSMASYYPCFGKLPALFEEIELGLLYDDAVNTQNSIERFRQKLTRLKHQKYLSHILNHFIGCTVVSQQERQLFNTNFPEHNGKVTVIPNCVNFDDYQGLGVVPKPNQLMFSGSFRYRVNYDAMLWFIREIYPRILDHLPDTRLIITGDHENLPLPPAPNITLTGYVEDIKSLMASSWVSVAPLLSGGGTRLKILEAMALGNPVVSTSKGAEGLNVVHGEHVLVADSPLAFADQVINVLQDKELHDRLSCNGKRFIEENYNWISVLPRFLQLVESVGC